MPKGPSREPWHLSDVAKSPITASIHKASLITGLSSQTLKILVDTGKIKGVKTSEDSSKIMVSMYSLYKFLDGPVEALERIWTKESA